MWAAVGLRPPQPRPERHIVDEYQGLGAWQRHLPASVSFGLRLARAGPAGRELDERQALTSLLYFLLMCLIVRPHPQAPAVKDGGQGQTLSAKQEQRFRVCLPHRAVICKCTFCIYFPWQMRTEGHWGLEIQRWARQGLCRQRVRVNAGRGRQPDSGNTHEK